MPLSYTVYGCTYKCGHRHTSNRKRVELHESRCWYNPGNRTCKTCWHEQYHSDTSGWSECGGEMAREPDWWERSCGRGDGEPLIDAIYDALFAAHPDKPNLYNYQVPPVIDCPYWETGPLPPVTV